MRYAQSIMLRRVGRGIYSIEIDGIPTACVHSEKEDIWKAVDRELQRRDIAR